MRIDGRERDIVSLVPVKVDTARADDPAAAEAPLVSSNITPAAGRRLVVAVDRTLIRPGSVTPLIRTAGEFVAGLTPDDYAALLAFPEPGPRVDFTRDRARVQESIERVVGQSSPQRLRQFDIQTWEALTLELELLQRDVNDPDEPLTPTEQRVLERGCDGVRLEETRWRTP